MSELREEVPGDVGYGVERFVRENCQHEPNHFCPNLMCFPCEKIGYSKPSPVLGETVNLEGFNTEKSAAHIKAYDEAMRSQFTPVLGETVIKYYPVRGYEWNMKQQDSYTRKKVAEVIKAIARKYAGNVYAITGEDFDQLLKDLEG